MQFAQEKPVGACVAGERRLAPLHGCTQVELRHDLYVDFENPPTHEEGWNGALDNLELFLEEKS